MCKQKQSAVEYNRSIIPRLSELTKPLEIFGISSFGIVKIFHDKWFVTGTHQDWVCHFIDKIQCDADYVKTIKKEIAKSNGIIMYANSDKDLNTKSYQELLSFNLWNGLNIYNIHDDHIEYCYFLANPQQKDMSLAYIHHLELLKKYVKHIKTKAVDLIEVTDRSMLIQTNQPINFKSTLDQINNESKKAEYLLREMRSHNKINGLTQRELECIAYFSKGYTMKEIASKLNISPRTIETHINNIKIKLGVRYKNELREISNELHLVEL